MSTQAQFRNGTTAEYLYGGLATFLEEAGDPDAVADAVQLYSKDVAGTSQLFARVDDGTVYQLTPVSSGGVTLDGAYDFGGPGAGRTITVDSGAVQLTGGGTTVGGLTVDGARTIASAAGAIWSEVLVDADVSVSGSTTITTATGFNMVSLMTPTITDTGTVPSISNSATLYIQGEPVGSGVTITNGYSLWVDSGDTRFDGSVELGAGGTIASGSRIAVSGDSGTHILWRGSATSRAIEFQTTAATGGAIGHFFFRPGPDTNQTAGTEVRDMYFEFNQIMQHATGAIAVQRSFVVAPRTYSFVGASTITDAATVAIEGAPVAGTNATITNSYALWVQSGTAQFGGDVNIAGKLTVTGAIDPPSILLSGGTTELYFESNNGETAPVSGAATGRIRYNNTTAAWEVSVQGGAYAAISTGAGSGGTLNDAYDFGGAGAGRTITVDSGAVQLTGGGTTVGGLTINGSRTIASGPAATWNELLIDADLSLSGGTITPGLSMVTLNTPTITDAGTVPSVTTATTLYIEGAPIPSGLSFSGGAFALWIDSGDALFDGVILNSTGSLSNPSYTFFGDTNTGMFRSAPDTINFTTGGGSSRLEINNTAVIVGASMFVFPSGAASSPGAAVSGDLNTGVFSGGPDVIGFTTGGVARITVSGVNAGTENNLWLQPTNTSGATTGWVFRGAPSTNQSAGTEVLDFDFDLDATLTHAAGNYATQRSILMRPRTYGFPSLSTITAAATLQVQGSPAEGVNALITTSLALWVASAGSGSFNTYFGATPSLGGGMGVIGIANAGVNPSADPSGGGILYSNAGAGTWRGSGGSVTAFGPAGPHCEECGYDEWTVATLNTVWKSWRFECGHCGAVYAGGPKDVRDLLPREHREKTIRQHMVFEEIERLVA